MLSSALSRFVQMMLVMPGFAYAKMRAATKSKTKTIPELKIKEACIEPQELGSVVEAKEPILLKGFLKNFDFCDLLQPENMKEAWGEHDVLSLCAPQSQRTFSAQTREQVRINYGRLVSHIFGESNLDEQNRYYATFGGDPIVLSQLKRECSFPRPLAHTSIWVGGDGNISTFHADPWHAFLGQTIGEKLVVIVNPWDIYHLRLKSVLRRDFFLSNCSELPDDIRDITAQSHPDFFKARRYQIAMQPSDFLYLPPHWWHTVVTTKHAVSVLLRYEARPQELYGPTAMRSLCAMTLRDWGVLKERPMDSNDPNEVWGEQFELNRLRTATTAPFRVG